MSSAFLSKYTPLIWYELGWPGDVDAKAVNAWLQSMSGSDSSNGARFVVVCSNNEVHHYFGAPKQHADELMHFIRTFLPDVEIIRQEKPLDIRLTLIGSLRVSPLTRPLSTVNPENVSHAILNNTASLGPNERIAFTWMLGPRVAPKFINNKTTAFRALTIGGMLLEALVRPPQPLDGTERKAQRDKQSLPGWKAMSYVAVKAADRKRAGRLLSQVLGTVRAAEAPGVHISMRRIPNKRFDMSESPWLWPITINVNELTGLLAWPLGERALPGITRITSKRLPVRAIVPSSNRIIAQSNIPGSNVMLTQSPKDALMHTHVLGPTGVGKSTLLLNMICQDMASNAPVIVVDPKGDLVQDVLERVPEKRKNDVILLDPSDAKRPVGLNPLARSGQPSSLIADDILSIFHGLYGSYFGPRTQDILHAGLLTLASNPGMSLCTLPILYTNPAFRYRLVSRLNDPLGLEGFWRWFDTISAAERNNVLAPVMNKLRAFLLRPAMRRVIGQPRPKFTMEHVFTNRKILLVNLAKGQLGAETAKLFGSLVVSQIWQAIQSRGNIPQSSRTPAFVYIDEVQDYLHLPTDIGDVLAQSRGFGVGLIMAHQHLNQLPTELKAGVLANARSKICFQLGHDDAVAMTRNSKLLSPSDFEHLGRYNIYSRLVANGEVMPWASGRTTAPPKPTSIPDEIRTLSREKYGMDIADVEMALGGTIAGEFMPPKRVIGRKKIGEQP